MENTAKYLSEQGHWYSADGKPQYTITGKNGKERGTTLRDARELNLFPSVTTIMGMAAKPALENWKITQALLSALTLPRIEGESLDDFMERAKKDAKDSSYKAAERGTEIHADIERGFLHGAPSAAYAAVRACLDSLYPGEQWIAEGSFSCPEGYGGKIDLYSKRGIYVDFKSKELKDTDIPEKLVYDEHGMQLSAYACGTGCHYPERISIFVDRIDCSKVLCHKWDKESHERHLGMFLRLLEYWQLSKGYAPSQKGANP